MKRIAIILHREIDLYGDDDYRSVSRKIVEAITDWTEVSDEEYEILKRAQSYDYHHRFMLIERPGDEPEFVKKTVTDYLAWAKNEEAKREKEKQKALQVAADRKAKKEAKTVAEKKKLLDKLKAELGEQ